ncbi:hypothetical protein SEA_BENTHERDUNTHAT_30 [Gordonia phage BENtherdunthat]|uniref:DUF7572 domain-containing protein n=1 Tax=Gordonia phage BENtherdunthat TaxID=2047830 RepID=A0A2H4PF63_9CAUD|nr:minor tail protein [Gordonia phage BENtherdunthat]ATW60800.1 hypothetical protein SEA_BENTHERDUNTHAT_30 [Gordonia phage BENtherdunthat]
MDVEYVCEATWMPPTTNLYRCGDGRHLLVLVVSVPDVVALTASTGMRVPIARSHITPEVSVFLADEQGQVVDYDGDVANGLTPIASTNTRSFATTILPSEICSHAEALAVLGYTLTEQETS